MIFPLNIRRNYSSEVIRELFLGGSVGSFMVFCDLDLFRGMPPSRFVHKVRFFIQASGGRREKELLKGRVSLRKMMQCSCGMEAAGPQQAVSLIIR